MEFEITHQPREEARDAIGAGLRAYNKLHLGEFEWTALDVYARDPQGPVVGGLIGYFALGWLTIHVLWVEEGHRGQGLGSAILKKAEDEALRNGCHGAVLDTLSFQAPAFYEKRGYVRIGMVEDYIGGCRRFFLQKRL